MRGRRGRWASLILLGILLSGCWDRREIEERNTVMASGIDVCPEEEGEDEECAWMTTRQIAIPGRIPLGGGSGQTGRPGQSVVVQKVPARNGPDSQAQAQVELNRTLSFGHMRLLVLSEAFARRPMGEMLDYSRRIPEARRLLWVVVSEGPAEAVIRAAPPLEQVPALYLNDMLDEAVKTGRIPQIVLGEFLIRFSNKGEEAIAPLIRMEAPNRPALSGLALFRGDRMVGKLTPAETAAYMELRGQRRGAELLQVDLPGGERADVFIYGRGVSRQVRWDGNRVHVRIKVELESEIVQLSPALDGSDPALIELIEDRGSAAVIERSRRLVEKLQGEYQADALAIGELVRAYLPAVWQRIDDWPAEFVRARFSFDVKLHVRRAGMSLD